jgi:hypothetical protein
MGGRYLNCSSLEPRYEPAKGRSRFGDLLHVAYGSFAAGRRPRHRLAPVPASGTAALAAVAGLGVLLFVVFIVVYAVASRAGEPAKGASGTPLSVLLVAGC